MKMKMKDNGLDETSLVTWLPPAIGRMTLSGCEINKVYWYSFVVRAHKLTHKQKKKQ